MLSHLINAVIFGALVRSVTRACHSLCGGSQRAHFPVVKQAVSSRFRNAPSPGVGFNFSQAVWKRCDIANKRIYELPTVARRFA